jgi:hypothetical protein
MANPEHLQVLKQGVDVWNKWIQEKNHLGQTHRHIADLSRADLSRAKLRHIDFRQVDLSHTDLSRADLMNTDLRSADLSNVSFHNSTLDYAHLSHAKLSHVDLSRTSLTAARFNYARLGNANLNHAHLNQADFSHANLCHADLSHANLRDANFSRADLYGANLTNCTLGFTNLGSVDLSKAAGLGTVKHSYPSTIGIDTIYESQGNIPEVFLRGCGVPEPFIAQIPALVAALEPAQFYKCFISYSNKDQKFADRLYADLQNKGVRCWLATEDLKIGDRIRVGIDEAIRMHDKLLLVLSKHSVASNWVEQEVETALERERKEKRTVLFPIRLDEAVMKVESGWPVLIRNARHIGDFRKWKDHDSYQKSFERLLRDLKAGA